MDASFKDEFLPKWRKYFGDQDLPIGYFHADHVSEADRTASQDTDRCLIGNLNRVREGHPFVYEATTPGCSGGERYSGFSHTLRPNFEYFLSCGIPGEVEGERYKKSPQLVREYLKAHPAFDAPGESLVFNRLDKFGVDESPLAVIFFAAPDVLSGLFTLANYDSADPQQVIAPIELRRKGTLQLHPGGGFAPTSFPGMTCLWTPIEQGTPPATSRITSSGHRSTDGPYWSVGLPLASGN
jgi:hypothetical protein